MKSDKKILLFKLSNGETYGMLAENIARNRAEYYIKRDIDCGDELEKDRERLIQQDIDLSLSDEYELGDWISNNMNWKDLKPLGLEFMHYCHRSDDYDEMFRSCKFDLVNESMVKEAYNFTDVDFLKRVNNDK